MTSAFICCTEYLHSALISIYQNILVYEFLLQGDKLKNKIKSDRDKDNVEDTGPPCKRSKLQHDEKQESAEDDGDGVFVS